MHGGTCRACSQRKRQTWRVTKLPFQALLACAAVVYPEFRTHASKSPTFALGLSTTSLRLGLRTVPGQGARRDRHLLHFFGLSSGQLLEKLDTYIATVSSYTDREVACMPAKWRSLLVGIRAGLRLPSLLEAVRMLYVDILPLRLGGDFIMKGITGMIQEGKEKTKATIPDADVISASTLFEALDVDGSGKISEQNLQAFGFTPSAIAEIMDAVDADGNHQIDLFEFMADQVGDDEPDVFDILGHHLASADVAVSLSPQDIQLIVSQMRSNMDCSAASGSKYEARFNDILQFIVDLEPKLEKGTISNKRMQTMLAGSFEAAKDPDVVAALRFVYCEIMPLRVAGDLVYGIVTKSVGT